MIIFALLWIALALAELTLFQTPILILLFLGFTIYYARRDHLRTTVHTQVGTDRWAVLPNATPARWDTFLKDAGVKPGDELILEHGTATLDPKAAEDLMRWSPERIQGKARQ